MCNTICCVCFEYEMGGPENKGIEGNMGILHMCVLCKEDSTYASPYRLGGLMIIGGGRKPGN